MGFTALNQRSSTLNRSLQLSITPAGLAVVNVAIKKVEAVDQSFFAKLEQL
jgi:hypothetical protein